MEILEDHSSLIGASGRGASRPCGSGHLRLGSLRRLMRHATSLALTLALFTLAGRTPMAQAHAQVANEYQVKAAFLYNFAKFVEWSPEAFADASAPIILGIIGEDPFGGALDQTISGKTANNHPLVIKRLKWSDNLRECKILFISASERKHLPQILESIKGAGVLTVSQMDRFAHLGGVINFTIKDNKVGFEINVDAAARAPLKISSKLLALAKVVRDEQRVGKK